MRRTLRLIELEGPPARRITEAHREAARRGIAAAREALAEAAEAADRRIQ